MLMDKLISMLFGLTFNPQEFFLISAYCEGDVSFAVTFSGSWKKSRPLFLMFPRQAGQGAPVAHSEFLCKVAF